MSQIMRIYSSYQLVDLVLLQVVVGDSGPVRSNIVVFESGSRGLDPYRAVLAVLEAAKCYADSSRLSDCLAHCEGGYEGHLYPTHKMIDPPP